MTIGSVKPLLPDAPAQTGSGRPAADAGDFAAIARSVAAGDLVAARAALAGSGAAQGAGTLAQTLAAGNLAAARLALAQLGANAFATRDTAATGPLEGTAPFIAPPSPSVPGAPGPEADLPDMKIAGAAAVVQAASPSATGAGMVVDVGATLASAGASGQSGAGPRVTSANGGSYSVADVMLALATGNAGSIPADVINLYGPGGAKYDPAAIMDAYRNSPIGQAQMAMFAWMGKHA